MLIYTKGEQIDTLVTLTELTTLTNPYYLFVFTNITTKEQLTINVNSASDLSDYPERINVFSIDIVTLFQNSKAGQYSYEVYEQLSSTNINPAGLNLVECGKMKLLPATNLIKEGYEPQTTYKGYTG